MRWISALSEAHVKFATIFTKLDALQQSVGGLAKENQQLALAVAEMKGALSNSATPELLRQLEEVRQQAAATERRVGRVEFELPERPSIQISAKRDGNPNPRPIGQPEN